MSTAIERNASPDPYKWRAVLFASVILTTLPATFGLMLTMDPEVSPDPVAAAAERLGVDRFSLLAGGEVFQTSCATCHGPEGQGVPRLGKPLKNSAFVQSSTDEELLAVIRDGRGPADPGNTTGMLMPPRGANPRLSDARLIDVVGYLRMLQEPGAPLVSMEAWERPPAVSTGTASQPGADAAASLADAIGRHAFVTSCSACHGERGEGLDGLGKPLAGSEFVQSKTDAELTTFVKQGRPIWDAENTTGLDMPPKGGNPALGDAELAEIIQFIRTLQPSAGDA